MLAEVTGFDLERARGRARPPPERRRRASLGYDTLIVAGGSRYSYFGHDEWQDARAGAEVAEPARSTSAAASSPRSRRPRSSPTPSARRAGSRSSSSAPGRPASRWRARSPSSRTTTLRRDFRSVDTRTARVLLVEAADRVLPSFPGVALAQGGTRARAARRHAARRAHGRRRRRRLGRDPGGRTARSRRSSHAHGDLGRRRHRLRARRDSSQARPALDVDRAGRVTVGPDLTLPGHPEVFALGDMVTVQRRRRNDRRRCPGVAPVAMQQGRYAARAIRRPPPWPARPARSATSTRATSPRSAARRPSPTSRGSTLAGFPAWVTLARRPPLLPDRLPEPAARRAPLDDQLRHPRTRRAADRPPIGANRRRASRQPSPGPRRPCRRPRRAPVDPCRPSDGSTAFGQRTFPRARANKEGRSPT